MGAGKRSRSAEMVPPLEDPQAVPAAGPAVQEQAGRAARRGKRVRAVRDAGTTSPGETGAVSGPPTDLATDAASPAVSGSVSGSAASDESPATGPSGDLNPPPGPALETRNEVVLVGRVAAPAQERTLPSGDVLATWRVVVERPSEGRPLPAGVRTSSVDTLNCVAWRAGTRRTARGLAAGDVVQVAGALRRRFWRAGGGPVSLCEVEVTTLTRLAKAVSPAKR